MKNSLALVGIAIILVALSECNGHSVVFSSPVLSDPANTYPSKGVLMLKQFLKLSAIPEEQKPFADDIILEAERHFNSCYKTYRIRKEFQVFRECIGDEVINATHRLRMLKSH